MSWNRILAGLTLEVLLVLLGFGGKAVAQNPGDYVTQWTYDIQTPYAFPANPPTTNPFCSGPNANCYFTEIDVFAGSTTTSSEIDVWTPTTIEPSMISNGFVVYAANYIDLWVPNPGYWNNLVGAGPFESEPTARSPQTGVLSYTTATEGNYYGQAAIYQLGAFQPDSTTRWMPSIAMDKAGDIAVGYSMSNSSTVDPSVGITGRVPLALQFYGGFLVVDGAANSGSNCGIQNHLYS